MTTYTAPTAGQTQNIDFDTYIELDAVNASAVKAIATRGLAAAHIKPKASKAMQTGTIVHAKILEDRRLWRLRPAGQSPYTKAGKEWKEEQEKKGLYVLNDDDAAVIEGICASIEETPEAADLLDQCQHREQTITFDWGGVTCKARLDAHGHTSNLAPLVLDLKTIDNLDNWERTYWSLGYDLQAAFYAAAYSAAFGDLPAFAFLVAEKAAPHRVGIYWQEVTPEQLAEVYELTQQAAAALAVHPDVLRGHLTEEKTMPTEPPLWLYEQRVKQATANADLLAYI